MIEMSLYIVRVRSAQRLAPSARLTSIHWSQSQLDEAPLTWSPSHIEKGETMLFLWKPHTGTAGLEPGTHAWLARQSGALAIAPCPLPCAYVLYGTVDHIVYWGCCYAVNDGEGAAIRWTYIMVNTIRGKRWGAVPTAVRGPTRTACLEGNHELDELYSDLHGNRSQTAFHPQNDIRFQMPMKPFFLTKKQEL